MTLGGNVRASQARQAIEASLARGSGTPSAGRSDRDAYLAERSQELLAALIDPVKASVERRSYDYEHKGIAEYEEAFAIAQSGESWLLYLPAGAQFALAFGKQASSLSALGFSSTDALAEWLG